MNDKIIAELTHNGFKIGVTPEGMFVTNSGADSKEFKTYREATKAIDDFICLKNVAGYPVVVDVGNYCYEKGIVIDLNRSTNFAKVERGDGHSKWEYIDNLFSLNSETQTMIGNIMRWGEDTKQKYEAIRELKRTLEHDYSFERVLSKVVKK